MFLLLDYTIKVYHPWLGRLLDSLPQGNEMDAVERAVKAAYLAREKDDHN
jgi:hypothetical protein